MRFAAALMALFLAGCDDGVYVDLDFAVADLGPTPDLSFTLLVAHADWVDACQTLAGCNLSPSSVSQCIGTEQQPGHTPPLLPSVIGCLRLAGADCTAAEICLNGGDKNVDCNPDTTAPACDGTVLSYCNQPGKKFSADCAALGFACSNPGPNAGCGPSGSCGQSGATVCAGNVQARCQGGRLVPRDDCRIYDGVGCDTDLGLCSGHGPACGDDPDAGTSFAPRCDGSRAIACKNGHEAGFDCAQLGLGCVAGSCARGSECTAAHADSCAGPMLTYCDSGLLATIDCTASGWATCVPSENGRGACSH